MPVKRFCSSSSRPTGVSAGSLAHEALSMASALEDAADSASNDAICCLSGFTVSSILLNGSEPTPGAKPLHADASVMLAGGCWVMISAAAAVDLLVRLARDLIVRAALGE